MASRSLEHRHLARGGLCLAGLACAALVAGSVQAQDVVTCDGQTLDDSEFNEPIVRDHRDTKRGALHNPTGRPLGGGEDYGAWVSRPRNSVRTRDELLAALAGAQSGEIVYVADDAVIDLSRRPLHPRPPPADPCFGFGLIIPDGVTLASGRGREGSLGALLFTRSFGRCCGMLLGRGDGVRITGLRLRGPDTGIEQGDPARCAQEPFGIVVAVGGPSPTPTASDACAPFGAGPAPAPAHWSVEIDNNELYGWPRGGVWVNRVMGVHVHHNVIHYNRRQEHDGTCPEDYGLGHGIAVYPGSVLIEGNVFDHNRHDIASDGGAGARYEARYNLSLAGAVQHSFDVHGGRDREDCTDVAGSAFIVHHNTFLQAHKPAFRIRGVPLQGAWIYRNETRDDRPFYAFSQVNASGKFHVEENDMRRNYFPAWFISYGGESFWALRRFESTPMSEIAVGDFDGEGGVDVFRATGSEWEISRGARGDWRHLNTSSIRVPHLAFGDFVGDGRTDVFRATGDEWQVSESGTGQWAHLNTSSIRLQNLAFGDFVGDDKTDVFRATGEAWRVSESGRGPWSHLNTSTVRLPELAFADLDGDGRTDVLRAAGGLWYVSLGGRSEWKEWNRSDLPLSRLVFGDFNGDRRADALSRQSPDP